MTKWNVYKVFANGNRAKKPYCSFESETQEHFYEEILPTMSEKLQNSNWQLIDDRLPQEAVDDQPVVTETDLMARKRNKFLSSLVTTMYPDLESHRHQSCLMFLPETNWKWCWCVAEASTLKYVGQLSARFDTALEAEQWIRNQLGD